MNIKKYISFIIVIISAILTSCTDESLPKHMEYSISSLKIDYTSLKSDAITTRLSEKEEENINNLYIFIFENNKDKAYPIFRKKYFPDLSGDNRGSVNFDNIKINRDISVLIYAVANCEGSEMRNFREKLDNVKNRGDLEKIDIELVSKESLDRIKPRLVMSGKTDVISIDDLEPVDKGSTKTAGNKELKLKNPVKLKRVDSYIKFEIITGEQIKSFTPKTWKVCNIPLRAHLYEKEKGQEEYITDKKYFHTNEKAEIRFEKEDHKYSFDFYMLENKQKAKKECETYEHREKRIKEELDEDDEKKEGQEVKNGNFEYAPDAGTYIEITADMAIAKNNSNPERPERFANVKYTIHLGDTRENKYNNFNTNRNSKYTYTIKINGVDNIVAEVNEEDPSKEPQPSAEGDVYDMGDTRRYNLDCHFHTFIVKLGKGDAEKFKIQTPFTTITKSNIESIDSDDEDLRWIEFKRNKKNTVAENHKNDEHGKLLTINQLYDDLDTNGKGYYTVFVKEYFYEKAPHNRNWGDKDENKWPYFVNMPDRSAIIYSTEIKYSPDGESSHRQSSYIFNQMPIQTYMERGADVGLGVEHFNEFKQSFPGRDEYMVRESDEYKNKICQSSYRLDKNTPDLAYERFVEHITYNVKRRWDEILNYEFEEEDIGNNKINNIKIRFKDAGIQCLSRNRDENGDGYIQAEEIKWYLPNINQLIEIGIGKESMITPLFDADAVKEVKYPNVAQYHYISAEMYKLWSEEVCSVSKEEEQVDKPHFPRQVRCVRNLSPNRRTMPKNAVVYDEDTNIITINNYDWRSIRPNYIAEGSLAEHDSFNPINKPYIKFKVAKDFIYKEKIEAYTIDEIKKDPCRNYTEENGRDMGKWRMPNQVELVLMAQADPQNESLVTKKKEELEDLPYATYGRYEARSCTYWKYDKSRFFGWTFNERYEYLIGQPFLLNDGDKFCIIRCVRDWME